MHYRLLYSALCTSGLGLILSVTGCSDGERAQSSGMPQKTHVTRQVLAFDSQNVGIPDVFLDAKADDDDGDGYIEEITIPVQRCLERAKCVLRGEQSDLYCDSKSPMVRLESYLVDPCYYRVTSNSGDDTPTAVFHPADIHVLTLRSGVRYSLTLQSPSGRGDMALVYQPTVSVIAKDDYLAEKLENALNLELTHSDHGLRYANYSFVAPKEGEYVISVSNAAPPDSQLVYDSEELLSSDTALHLTQYCYSIYPDAEKYGHTVCFTDANGEVYNLEEMQYLRRCLAPFVLDAEGERPSRLSENTINGLTARQTYDQALAFLGEQVPETVSKSTDAADQQFFWDSGKTDLGVGYHDLGLIEADASAVESFTLPEASSDIETKELNPPRFLNNCYESQGSFFENLCIPALPIPLVPFTFGYNKTLEHSYGVSSGTLLLSCVVREKSSRLADSYTLTQSASDYLNREGEEAFRQRYGDSFVAGALYGNYYRARISFQATDAKAAKKVETDFNVDFGKMITVGACLRERGEEAFKDCRICVQKEVLGDISADPTVKIYFDPETNSWVESDQPVFIDSPKAALFSRLAQEYETFKSRAERGEMVRAPLTAHLRHYSAIDSRLTPEDAASAELSAIGADIKRNLQDAQVYCSEYTEHPAEYFSEGRQHQEAVKDKVEEQIDDIENSMYDLVDAPSVSVDQLNALHERSSILAQEMRDKTERCSFYVQLKDAQNAIPGGSMLPEGGHGICEYPQSRCVDNDIMKGTGMIRDYFMTTVFDKLFGSVWYRDTSFDGYCYLTHDYVYPVIAPVGSRICFFGWFRDESLFDRQWAYYQSLKLGNPGNYPGFMTIHTIPGGYSNYRAGFGCFNASQYNDFRW